MSRKKALIVWGGWDGHQPKEVAEIFRRVMTEDGFDVEVSDTLDAFLDKEKLSSLSVIVPIWTMGNISGEQAKGVMDAVSSGVGLAGCHGGMCDAFRGSLDWQMMTGGQFVAHPGNQIPYTVNLGPNPSPITEGVKDFDVVTEQYYMLVDPAIRVLATTTPTVEGAFNHNGPIKMPVVWTKNWGKGRVFYNALGHDAKVVASEPSLTMQRRGFLWAAGA